MESDKPGTQDLVLDLSSFRLIREGHPVKLEKTPMELLRLLVRRRGTVVTREEIVSAIWGDEVHVDVEAGINTAIRKIRQALEDNAGSPRYLETVVGRGYRFVGEIEVVDPEVPVRSATPAPSERSSPWLWMGAFPLAVVAVFLLARFASQNHTSAVSKENAGRVIIGVARLQNLSPDSGQDYFAEGLTDEILTQLGQLNPERLGVVNYAAPPTAQSSGGSAKPDQKSALQYTLEGSVRRDHQQARISVRLVRAADEMTVWADSFDRHVGDVLVLQSEIAQRIGRELQIQVLGRGDRKAVAPEVAEAYLRGRFELHRRDLDSDAARVYFERAIALDPSYAPAHAGLADFYSSRAVGNDDSAAEAWRLAEQNAARALALDPENAEAHTAMAKIKLAHDWDWQAAREHALHALQLNPSSPEAHSVYAGYLRVAGKEGEAVNQRKQAVALDPLRVDLEVDLGFENLFARDFQSAVASWRRVAALDPYNPYGCGGLCGDLGRLKRFDEAGPECSKELALIGHADWVPAYMREYREHGYEAAALFVAKKNLQKVLKQPHPDLWDLANAYVLAGMREETMRTLYQGLSIREPGLLQLRVDPDFDPIRNDPRYAELVRRIGFPND
jgi:TolB-like protein/DNA-binding winged helix-turn-helix (wHTH) protein/Tfp pilus assembly protein PilF